MSNEAVQAILERTLVDESFRARLFASPHEALEGYELTESEELALRTVYEEREESTAGALDQRQSKAVPFWLTNG